MSSKITIIGAGSVGSTIAYTLSNQDIASEIVLIDINKEKVAGEVMDIIQGTCFRDPISIIAGDYEDARDSDIVIITSGIARKPGQTRLELTQTNVNILKSITPEIVKAAPNALYLIVSNPVDIMTYVFTKISGLPENQILGSGTILDSARLRCGLSEHFQIAQSNIHAYVFGEHGDTSFVPWSCAWMNITTLRRNSVRILNRLIKKQCFSMYRNLAVRSFPRKVQLSMQYPLLYANFAAFLYLLQSLSLQYLL